MDLNLFQSHSHHLLSAFVSASFHSKSIQKSRRYSHSRHHTFVHQTSTSPSLLHTTRESISNASIHRNTSVTSSEELSLIDQIQQVSNLIHLRNTLRLSLGRFPSYVELCTASSEYNTEHEIQQVFYRGNQAVDQFWNVHQGLIEFWLRKSDLKQCTLEDARQHAAIALFRAAQKYEPHLGWKFSTYAKMWIRGAIWKAVSAHTFCFYAPQRVKNLAMRASSVSEKWYAKYGEMPSDLRLAKMLDVAEEELDASIACGRAYSLELCLEVRNTEWLSFSADSFEHEKEYESMELRDSVYTLLDCACLSERERHAIMLRFGLSDHVPHTLPQIGALMGVSKQRVDAIIRRALGKLRDSPTLQQWRRDSA